MDNTIATDVIQQKLNQDEGNISDDEKPATTTKQVSKNALAGKENESMHEAIEIIAFKPKTEQKAFVIQQKINQNEGNISDNEKPKIVTKQVSKNALAGKENKSVHEAIEIIAFKPKTEDEAPSFLLKLVKLFMALLLLGTITSYALRDTACQNNTSDFCQGVSKTTNSIDQN
jgi:FtsZ-interacting cell division protein YlmF